MSAVDNVILDKHREIVENAKRAERDRAVAIIEDALKYEYMPLVIKIVERIREGE